jgi:hypothetical protein
MAILSFDDTQKDRIFQAAALLPVERRNQFMRIVGNRLGDLPHQAQTADIEAAISFALPTFGIAIGGAASRKQPTDNLKKLRRQRARSMWGANKETNHAKSVR